MFRAPHALRVALVVTLSTGCGSDPLPNLDINGVWSLNWMATRYPASDLDTWYFAPDRLTAGVTHTDEVYFDLLIFEIERLGTSHDRGSDNDAGIRALAHYCPLGWSRGTSSTLDL